MRYVLKRNPVRYQNGTMSPEGYFKGTPLGLFVELTREIAEAKVYNRKADAKRQNDMLGGKYEIVKVE